MQINVDNRLNSLYNIVKYLSSIEEKFLKIQKAGEMALCLRKVFEDISSEDREPPPVFSILIQKYFGRGISENGGKDCEIYAEKY